MVLKELGSQAGVAGIARAAGCVESPAVSSQLPGIDPKHFERARDGRGVHECPCGLFDDEGKCQPQEVSLA